MIKFKNNQVRVRCLECRNEHFINMEFIKTDKQQRSISFEYEHTFKGKLKCSNCGEKMKLKIMIYEYPKGILNYIDIGNKSCLEMDTFDESVLDIS